VIGPTFRRHRSRVTRRGGLRRGLRRFVAVAVAIASLAAPGVAAAQAVSASEREALVALHVGRGGQAGDLDALIRLANETGAKGLPVRPLTDKIREGVSKRADPRRIERVIRQMATDLESADRIVREWTPSPATPGREAAVTLLAEALGGALTSEDDARRGLSAEEARELGRQVQAASRPSPPADTLASAAKGLAFIKDAKLSVPEGTVLVAEAARRGFRAYDLLDLGRQIKLRERDYQQGRATLRALHEAVTRGERPEQLFRDGRAGTIERPAMRPQPPDRPERPTRPEAPARPERPGRP
jgi:hypothetical protein